MNVRNSSNNSKPYWTEHRVLYNYSFNLTWFSIRSCPNLIISDNINKYKLVLLFHTINITFSCSITHTNTYKYVSHWINLELSDKILTLSNLFVSHQYLTCSFVLLLTGLIWFSCLFFEEIGYAKSRIDRNPIFHSLRYYRHVVIVLLPGWLPRDIRYCNNITNNQTWLLRIHKSINNMVLLCLTFWTQNKRYLIHLQIILSKLAF